MLDCQLVIAGRRIEPAQRGIGAVVAGQSLERPMVGGVRILDVTGLEEHVSKFHQTPGQVFGDRAAGFRREGHPGKRFRALASDKAMIGNTVVTCQVGAGLQHPPIGFLRRGVLPHLHEGIA